MRRAVRAICVPTVGHGMPSGGSALSEGGRASDTCPSGGIALYDEASRRELEGIVASGRAVRTGDGCSTSWLKIKNPTYSQMRGRRELFEARRDHRQRHRDHRTPVLGVA
jgi:hypothetical protein